MSDRETLKSLASLSLCFRCGEKTSSVYVTGMFICEECSKKQINRLRKIVRGEEMSVSKAEEAKRIFEVKNLLAKTDMSLADIARKTDVAYHKVHYHSKKIRGQNNKQKKKGTPLTNPLGKSSSRDIDRLKAQFKEKIERYEATIEKLEKTIEKKDEEINELIKANDMFNETANSLKAKNEILIDDLQKFASISDSNLIERNKELNEYKKKYEREKQKHDALLQYLIAIQKEIVL